jgi:hypothetical protein
MSFPRFENSRNVEVPPGRGRTGSAWGSATNTVVLRSTNSRFSEHHHGPRSRAWFLRFYHLSFKNSLAGGIYARGMGDPRRTLVRPIAAGRDGTLRLLLVWQDDRSGRGGSGMGGPHRILHWLRDLRDCCAVVADESGELGASLSCQVLQPSHCDKELSMTTASLDRTKVSILRSAFADTNIDKSRSVYFNSS